MKIIMSWNHIMITKMTVFSRSLTSTRFSACPRSSYFLWKSSPKIKLEKSQKWKLNSFGFKESLLLIDWIREKLSKMDGISEKLKTSTIYFCLPLQMHSTHLNMRHIHYFENLVTYRRHGRVTCTSDRLQQSQPCTHCNCSGSRNSDTAWLLPFLNRKSKPPQTRDFYFGLLMIMFLHLRPNVNDVEEFRLPFFYLPSGRAEHNLE